MASRFLRVDLSAPARDFQTVALEPGIPLLDKSNAHYRVLRKWLGRLIAEPEWVDDSVDFFVCDDQEARLDEVHCDPLTPDDLQRNRSLAREFQELSDRLDRTKHQSGEAKLHDAVVKEFQKLTAEPGPSQQECHLFKYRHGGVWQLVWAWGYQRKDVAPASATICTNPNCGLLFMRHSDGNRNCPACEQTPADGRVKPRKSRTRPIVGVCAVALIAAALGYGIHEWIGGGPPPAPPVPPGLRASPDQWAGPVGSRIPFAVMDQAEGGEEKDVTPSVVAVADNPKVVRLEDGSTTAHARSSGRSAVHFYLGDRVTHATVEVQPPRNPQKLSLKPDDLTLGVGTTAELRVMGEFEEGHTADLTEAAEWDPVATEYVYCYKGKLEGLTSGETTVVVRYRATPDDPYLQAEAKVKVNPEEYTSLDVAVEPNLLGEGKVGCLEATVTTDSGDKRSVLGSSQLKLEVDPPQLATIDADRLRALRIGKGLLKASFGDLTASHSFEVNIDELPPGFYVTPKDLQLAVGETAELQVVSPSTETIITESSAEEVVEVISATRVVGRAPGEAQITVSQGAFQGKVEVVVTRAPLTSIAFVPSRVAVPVDDSVVLRIVGKTDDDRQFDLTPDRLVWERLPISTIAELDRGTLRVRGRLPTRETPQTLVARWGELRAEALLDVVAPPLQIELTPVGPLQLAVGQVAKLRAWAKYGDGRRVEIPPGRVEWVSDLSGTEKLELDRSSASVRAVESGLSGAEVCVAYQGHNSNTVRISSVDAPFPLQLESDRSVILVGDIGRFESSIPDEAASDLTIEGVRFTSSDASVLEVEETSGAYRAKSAGSVTITAEHDNAVAPATLQLAVLEEATLVIRPERVTLLPGSRETLRVFMKAGDREEELSLVDDTGGVQVALAKPQAVRWRPPMLLGVSPAEPFAVTATRGEKTARATVEVVPALDSEIRVVPAQCSLAPGQMLAPRVEQRLPGEEEHWTEINPVKVRWEVPDSLVWTPANGDLRPQLTPRESATGTVELPAEHAGQRAVLAIRIQPPPHPIEPGEDARLTILREPGGEEVPVGARQRYTAMLNRGGQQEPATDVVWTPPFENDFVRWDPPVLTARRPGHEQRLWASVGDGRVPFTTRTVSPPRGGRPPDPAPGPSAVRIVSDAPTPVVVPVRAEFDDFAVQAIYPNGPPQDVTQFATLRIECDDPQQPPVAIEQGRIAGQRPGMAVVRAEYSGVRSAEGLPVEVVESVDYTALEIEPPEVNMAERETCSLKVKGFIGSPSEPQSVGYVTRRPELTWESDAPNVAETEGPYLEARAPGEAKVTVRAGGVFARADVTVAPVRTGEVLDVKPVLWPDVLYLRVGETKWLGSDVTLTDRATGRDFTDQAEFESSDPRIVRYDPVNRSLHGISPGECRLGVTCRGHFSLRAIVDRAPQPQGSLVIEPATGTLAVGEGQDLRVYLVSDEGARIDCTGRAMLRSEDPNILAVRGNRIAGRSPGSSRVAAMLPGIEPPGMARFAVVKQEPIELRIIPASLGLRVGERRQLRIEALGRSGRWELSDHPDLKIGAGGNSPDSIELGAGGYVRGVAPGNATIHASWRELKAAPVAVEVREEPVTGLAIEPQEAVVEEGGRVSFLVFAQSGDEQWAVTADDGVVLQVNDPSVARTGRDLTVRGVSPGTTEVVAHLGGQSAAAQLLVVPSSPPRAPDPRRLRFIPDILRMQDGVSGTSVRIVKVNSDGQEEDVDHRANIDVANPEVAEVTWTASGPVFVPKSPGQTSATASLEVGPATLTTPDPLYILVVDPTASPRLEVRPDPLRVALGRTAGFRRVQIVPGDGTVPVDVDYQVESAAPQIAEVEGGRILRGELPGRAQVTVTPVDVPERFADLSTNVTVLVEDAGGGGHLELTGPSRVTQHTEAPFHAELVSDSGRKDVTHDGAVLVLEGGDLSEEEEKGKQNEVLPGCILSAREPGTVNLRARYRDLISNPLPVRIDPISTPARLEIEIDRRPMSVGESRSYRLLGIPAGGGPPQDVTGLVHRQDPAPREPYARVVTLDVPDFKADDLVTHSPPTLVARAPGRFRLSATYHPNRDTEDPGSGYLESAAIELEILPEPAGEVYAVPASVTIRVGKHMPPVRAMVGLGGERRPRPMHAQWHSEDETILGPAPDAPGQLVGKREGKTRLIGVVGGQEAFVDVTVVGDPFQTVTVDDNAEWERGDSFFRVFIDIEASGHQAAGLEYRVFPVGDPGAGQWKTATVDGGRVGVRLRSESLRRGPVGTPYHLTIEARDKDGQTLASYPLVFKIVPQVRSGSNAR